MSEIKRLESEYEDALKELNAAEKDVEYVL